MLARYTHPVGRSFESVCGLLSGEVSTDGAGVEAMIAWTACP